MNKVFGLLGANQEITALVTDYMRVWYVGVVFVVVPMVGNNAIRACGDTLYPSLIMIISTLINIILDPLLIFGLAGFPRLELAGAALATVIARAFAFLLSLLILHFREKLIDFSLPKLKEVVDSCKKILYLGLPAAASRILLPLAVAIIMRLVAGFGPKAVAAVGAAVRIEMFVFMVIMALATALVPFAGQNWGAKKLDRLKLATSYSNTFSLVWGFLSFIFLLIFAGPLGRVFSKDPVVSQSITYYLWIMPLGYGLRSISMLTASLFNAINRPFASSALNITRMFFLYIPLAYFGSLWFGLSGLFFGLLLANILSGLIALRWQKALI
jgi:putative MATE family efflux protein